MKIIASLALLSALMLSAGTYGGNGDQVALASGANASLKLTGGALTNVTVISKTSEAPLLPLLSDGCSISICYDI